MKVQQNPEGINSSAACLFVLIVVFLLFVALITFLLLMITVHTPGLFQFSAE